MLKRVVLLSFITLWGLTSILWSQGFDYHTQESPAISWNGTPQFDARMLGAGGISLMASPVFAPSVNPALIPGVENISVGVSFGKLKHEAFQYWGLNNGVFFSAEPMGEELSGVNGLAIAVPLKRIRFSGGWFVSSPPELPSYLYDSEYWYYSGNFSGSADTFFAAAAVTLGDVLDVGLKIEYIAGKRDVFLDEIYKADQVRITREENHRLNLWAPSLGISFQASPNWTIAASLVYPIRGKAKRTLSRRFISETDTVGQLGLKSTDDLYGPARVYLSTAYSPWVKRGDPGKKILTLAAEFTQVMWSQYKYEFYREFQARDFRNTNIISLAVEFTAYGILWGDWTFRAGYRSDPQPVKSPAVRLQWVTGGVGAKFGRIALDVGFGYIEGDANPAGKMGKMEHWIVNGTLRFQF